jgi:hypothetical protein
VGRELLRDETATCLRVAAQSGARVENHTWSHPYDLSRMPATRIDSELGRAGKIIESVTDRRPIGFRAPGYVTNEMLDDAVRRAGFLYDASPLPSPAYYLAKVATLAAMRVAGRESVAIVSDPRAPWGPRMPHWDRGLWRIPMAVTRRLRLPVIGTALVLAGVRGARRLVRGCVGDPVVSIELHGVDFLDATDGLDDLGAHQWDVRVRLRDKFRALDAALVVLRDAGYAFVPLEAVTAHPRA